MAKLSDLISTLADAVDMPETTVGAYARRLRKAGKLSTGGRGFGGAEMTPRDAANLLIAVMSGSPTYAVERVSAYGALTCASVELGEASATLFRSLGLPLGHTFSSMIGTLISKSGEFPIMESIHRDLVEDGLTPEL